MKRRIALLAVPLAILSITSCKKLIEIEETDFIAGDLALKTIVQNNQGIVGSYAVFNPQMDINASGIFSDELKPGDFYASTSTHEWQYTSNDIGIRDNFTAITNYYYLVDRVNRVLRALPTATAANPTEEALRATLRGEALFLRAYAHFDLFRYYCGNYDPAGLAMPYMEVPSLETFARIPMSEFFTKLNRDIVEARDLLPNNLTDVGRATRLAAIGLQARIALYKREWPAAANFATEFINGLPLASGASFSAIWNDTGNGEVAFKKKFNTNTGRIGNFFRGIFPSPSTAPASISWVPSSKLWDSYDKANDIRFNAYYIDEPILAAAVGKPSKILKKYGGTGYSTANDNVADVKVFRTGEMYLIRAEARAEQGAFTGANSAEADLNTLRAARINGYTNVTLPSQAAAITAIMEERFKELALEGHRFWDLKRRSLPVARLSADAPTPQGQTLPADNFRFVLPIPNTELLANPKMVQNPGYAN
ncbi:MAG: RagB/SusD family nutrient uptake outer membrane protein [Chitinophagaceae bacterium]|nr:RagB/SusD family nutrient uptake outer membrane protein [Chitinophagaceae bacterium]